MSLFRIRALWAGELAGLLATITGGGPQFMLIIWLRGIWLPLTGRGFLPGLISGPFHHGLLIAVGMAIAMSVVGAVASMLRGTRHVHGEERSEQTPIAA